MKNIKYPEMRKELISCLESLSDIEYQQRVWVKKESFRDVEHDDFDCSVHFLYDDTDLASDPKSTIGLILCNDDEARKITDLVHEIDIIFDKYGTKLSDENYISLAEWKNVISKANEALIIINT
jgi:hypothetical protein